MNPLSGSFFMEINSQLAKIKLFVSDFDGVMTDGFVYLDQNGKESVRCSRKDGFGIELLKKNGVEVAVLSKENNPVVLARCEKLGVPVWSKLENGDSKLEILKKLMANKGLQREEVAYMGDDINDAACLKNVGLAITVADGHPEIKKIANFITTAKGGNHAVREVAELILTAQGVQLSSL